MVGWLIPVQVVWLPFSSSRFVLEFVCLILFHVVTTLTGCLAFSVARFASVVNGTEFGLLG